MMNYEDTINEYSDRSGSKAKSTWFSAQDVCILADLVRAHSDALNNSSSASPVPARNGKKRVWEIIAQRLAEKTNIPRTTRQVQKKWSNLRSSVRRASRSPVGTTVLPHYFLPVVKVLEEEENALDGNGSQETLEEDVDDLPQNDEELQRTRRKTYAVKIRHIQEQQHVEAERLSVLRQIKLESFERTEEDLEGEVQQADEHSEVSQEIQFSHVTIPDAANDGSYIAQLGTDATTASIWVNEGGDRDVGAESLETEDVDVDESPGESRADVPGTRKRSRPWPDWEEKKDDETKDIKLELLKAQLLLVQKETSLAERKIEKKDKEISLLDKEILKIDLEINFMKRKQKLEELKMGTFRK